MFHREISKTMHENANSVFKLNNVEKTILIFNNQQFVFL